MKDSKRFWLYNPKHGELYENVSEKEKNEILNDVGGVWDVFDHKPTEKELNDSFVEYLS